MNCFRKGGRREKARNEMKIRPPVNDSGWMGINVPLAEEKALY